MMIRDEHPADIPAIRAMVTRAFKNAPHSSGTEAAIVDRLRDDGALIVSLVAEEGEEVVGHVAFSPVRINAQTADWYGLGPVAVRPDRQGCGIGEALIEAGLDRLRSCDARGCVVLGDPAYYGRFGFGCDPELRLAGVPAAYFQRLGFRGDTPHGTVDYHPAFSAS